MAHRENWAAAGLAEVGAEAAQPRLALVEPVDSPAAGAEAVALHLTEARQAQEALALTAL